MYCAHILPFIRRHLLRRIMLHHWQLGRGHAVCIFYVQFFSKPIRAVRAAWISLKCVHNFLAEACVSMVSNILFLPSKCSLSNVSFPIFPFQYFLSNTLVRMFSLFQYSPIFPIPSECLPNTPQSSPESGVHINVQTAVSTSHCDQIANAHRLHKSQCH